MAGRPSKYSPEVAKEICERLINGETLYGICKDKDMPGYQTVFDWLDRYPDFRVWCARARELQAEFMDWKILDTAEKANKDNAYAAKVKIAAYQWRAMKLAPKKYGTTHVEQTINKSVRREPAEVEAERLKNKDSWQHKHSNGKGPPTIQ